MVEDRSHIMVKATVTLKKFDGDGANDPNATPVEVIEREEMVPLSSFAPDVQEQLLEQMRNTHGSD